MKADMDKNSQASVLEQSVTEMGLKLEEFYWTQHHYHHRNNVHDIESNLRKHIMKDENLLP